MQTSWSIKRYGKVKAGGKLGGPRAACQAGEQAGSRCELAPWQSPNGKRWCCSTLASCCCSPKPSVHTVSSPTRGGNLDTFQACTWRSLKSSKKMAGTFGNGCGRGLHPVHRRRDLFMVASRWRRTGSEDDHCRHRWPAALAVAQASVMQAAAGLSGGIVKRSP